MNRLVSVSVLLVLIGLLLLGVVLVGVQTQKEPVTNESTVEPSQTSVNEACENRGGDLCAENEVCLTSMIDLSGADRCCAMNCTIPKEATTENAVLIPAGTFLMGRAIRDGWSPMAAPEMFNDELPSHEVYVDAFYIDKYEVTNRQFKTFADATGYMTDAERYGGSEVLVPADQAQTPILGTDIGWKGVEGAKWYAPEGPGSNITDMMDHPVVHVSWNDANAYARWAGKRLPTEAEWEKAARGGTDTNWFWSDNLDNVGEYANMYAEHRKNYAYPPEVFDGYNKTAPVGSLRPNAYGLYDTAGNVFEWVSDWYQYDYFNTSPRNNPAGPTNGTERVIKGGSWYLCECYLRPANRGSGDMGDRNHGLGFRLALDAE